MFATIQSKLIFCLILFTIIMCFSNSTSATQKDETFPDYKTLLATCSEFAQVEQELNSIWKQIRGFLPSTEFEYLKKKQNEWLFKVREQTAKKIVMTQGFSYCQAMTYMSSQRTLYLRTLYEQARSELTGAQGPAAPSLPDTHSQETPWPPKADSNVKQEFNETSLKDKTKQAPPFSEPSLKDVAPLGEVRVTITPKASPSPAPPQRPSEMNMDVDYSY